MSNVKATEKYSVGKYFDYGSDKPYVLLFRSYDCKSSFPIITFDL